MPAKKPPAKKTTAKKPAAKKAPAKKTTAKKPAAKKSSAKKTATAIKETKPKETTSSNGTIAVEDEISKSFLDYAMSVICLLYTSPSPRDLSTSRMPSSA